MSTEPVAVRIRDLKQHEGETVRVQGWLYNRRSSKKLHFMLVRDGSGIVQCVLSLKEAGEALFEEAGAIGQESALRVTGSVRVDERAPGGVEMQATAIEVVGPATDYPISKQAHGPDFLLTNRHLWLRSRRPAAVLRIRDTVIRAIRDHLHAEGFVNVDAPVFTPNACEGTSTLFEVDYFGEPAYLTQSGQLYMEAAVMALGRVYCLGPTFRAEKSKTRKHLTEFWMLEPEMAYADLDDVMDLSQSLVHAIVGRVLEENRADLEVLERDVDRLEKSLQPFGRMTYDEAATILESKTGFVRGSDFGAPDEAALTEDLDTPLMVYRWPAEAKAFYMRRDPEHPGYVNAVDLLAPEDGGEILGGSERAMDLEYIERQMETHNLPREAFEWYLDLRRYGSVPHAGFGLGIERTLHWITGVQHIRETIPFPRLLGRIYP